MQTSALDAGATWRDAAAVDEFAVLRPVTLAPDGGRTSRTDRPACGFGAQETGRVHESLTKHYITSVR